MKILRQLIPLILAALFLCHCGFSGENPTGDFHHPDPPAQMGTEGLDEEIPAASAVVDNSDPPPPMPFRLHGLNFSPYIDLTPVTPERFARLVNLVSPYTRWIRTYVAADLIYFSTDAIKESELKLAAGANLSGDPWEDEVEILSLLHLIEKGDVDLAVVGGETLYWQALSESRLLSYMERIRQTGAVVTTNDTWNILLVHPEVIKACDVVMANFYPFWQGESIEDAVDVLADNYRTLKAVVDFVSPGKKIIVGETGWPSRGDTIGSAVPSPENAAAYFNGFSEWAEQQGVEYFYFEAFDELWKELFENPQGAHWGIWDENLSFKPGMENLFSNNR